MKMQIRSKTLVVLVSALMLTAFGCDKLKKKKKKKKGKKSKISKTMKRMKRDQQRRKDQSNRNAAADAHRRSQPGYAMGKKVGHYIQCTNHLSAAVSRTARRYHAWAKDNPKRPPTKRTKIVYGLYQINSTQLQKCNKAIATVPAAPDTPKLTAAGVEYQKAVKVVIPLVGSVYAYYKNKGHKKDGFKMAAKYHPQLLSAFKNFRSADKALRKEIDQISDGLEAARLARMKAKGENFWYYKALTQYQSKQMVRLVSPLDSPKGLDTKAFDKLKPGFIKTLKIFGALRKSDPEARRWRHLNNFIRALQNYAVQLDAIYTRATKKIKYTSTEKFNLKTKQAQRVKGHPAAVVDAYNKMIDVLNKR